MSRQPADDEMLRFVVRRLLLLVPILLGLSHPRLRLDSCPAGLAGRGAARRARDARDDRTASTTSTASTSRSTSSTGGTSTRPCTATSGPASRRPGRSRTSSSTASRRPSSSRWRRCSSRSSFGLPLGFFAAKEYGSWFDHASLFALADRDLDPDLLPRPDPQVRLRGPAPMVAERRAARTSSRNGRTRRTSTSSTRS